MSDFTRDDLRAIIAQRCSDRGEQYGFEGGAWLYTSGLDDAELCVDELTDAIWRAMKKAK